MAPWAQLLGKTANNPNIANVQPNELPPAPQLKLKLDRTQARVHGPRTITDVYSAVQLMLAPVYVNDFLFEGRVLRVTMQADAPFRMNDQSLQRFYLPAGTTADTNRFAFAGDNANDGMVPLSSLLQIDLDRGAAVAGALQRLSRREHQRQRPGLARARARR